MTVIDDYAHHPTEIAATLQAARERFPDRRIWAIFQPHTYSRTKALIDEFAAALAVADEIVLLDVYAAREIDDGTISSADLARRIGSAGSGRRGCPMSFRRFILFCGKGMSCSLSAPVTLPMPPPRSFVRSSEVHSNQDRSTESPSPVMSRTVTPPTSFRFLVIPISK